MFEMPGMEQWGVEQAVPPREQVDQAKILFHHFVPPDFSSSTNKTHTYGTSGTKNIPGSYKEEKGGVAVHITPR